MKVIVIEPRKKAYVKEIDSSLRSMQELVNGYIEAIYPFDDEVALVCNKEGKLIGEEANRVLRGEDGRVYDIICGTCFIAGLGEEDFTDVPEELVDKYLRMYEPREEFVRFGRNVYVNTYTPRGKCLRFMEQIV